MTELEKFREFVQKFPRYGELEGFFVDFTSALPSTGGVFPSGLEEMNRTRDVLGNVTCTNRLNFALYTVFRKDPEDNDSAVKNADWVAEFRDWVQEQSARGTAPVFGDSPLREKIMAQDGTLYDMDEEGTAMYMVRISVEYVKKFPKFQKKE